MLKRIAVGDLPLELVRLPKQESPTGYSLTHATTLLTDGGLAYRFYKQYGIPYIVAVRNTDVNVQYFTDLWDAEPTRYDYIDYDGRQKHYYNYSMPESGPKMRIPSYFKQRRIARKYLHRHYQQVSNLQICCFEAKEVVDVLTTLGRKGITTNLLPLTRGYKFESEQ